MKLLRRRVLAAVLSLTAALGGTLVAGPAHAQPVTTGSLSFSGDTGDYISQGDSWSYSTANGDGLTVSSSSGSTVAVSINAYNGDWWTLTIDAPGTEVLAPGTYAEAHRYPFNGTGPGLDLSGEGRGCNELVGSFTIINAVFGPDGYVETFDATFEQHCEEGNPAARGEVHISNAAAPPPADPPPPPAANPPPPAASDPAPPGVAPVGSDQATTAAGQPIVTATPSPANDARASSRGIVASPLLLIGVGVVAWLLLVAVVIVIVVVVLNNSRRGTRLPPGRRA